MLFEAEDRERKKERRLATRQTDKTAVCVRVCVRVRDNVYEPRQKFSVQQGFTPTGRPDWFSSQDVFLDLILASCESMRVRAPA